MSDTPKWTVYCRDTFDGTTWSKEFATEQAALTYARTTAGTMLTCHVDDPQGNLVKKLGEY